MNMLIVVGYDDVHKAEEMFSVVKITTAMSQTSYKIKNVIL